MEEPWLLEEVKFANQHTDRSGFGLTVIMGSIELGYLNVSIYSIHMENVEALINKLQFGVRIDMLV